MTRLHPDRHCGAVLALVLSITAIACRDPQLAACGEFSRDLHEGQLALKQALLAASAKPKDQRREILKQELARLKQKLERPSAVAEIASARDSYVKALSSAAGRLAAPPPEGPDLRLVLHDLANDEAMAFRKTMDLCSGAR